MKVTALKEILEQRININGCEDYENTFARMESDYTSRFGFKALMKSILCTKQSNLILHFLTLQNALTGPEACKCKCKCNFSLPTEHQGVYKNSFRNVRAFQIELEFGNVGF